MKCLRCGKEIDNNSIICENCGYDVSQQTNYRTIYVEADPDMSNKEIAKYIIAPILTFVFSLLASLCSILIVFTRPISILVTILFVIFFAISFFFSTRKTLVKLKPVRSFGVGLSYVSFFFSILIIFYNLINM